MNYTPLTYPCPKCGSRRVAQDPVCAEREKPLMLRFCCCDCGHKFEHPYVPPKAGTKYEEETTMKATYNGMTGELMKLERKVLYPVHCSADLKAMIEDSCVPRVYDLTIYDPEKKATVHFENVNLADVKFSGGEVSFR